MATGAVAASTELMRDLAHELRQPLGTIDSIAYYLRLILPADENVHEQLGRIQELVAQSNWILSSSQLFADPLPITRDTADLRELIERMNLAGVEVRIDQNIPRVSIDAPMLRTMIDNLIQMMRQLAGTTALCVTSSAGRAVIELSTTAAGHRSENSFGPGGTLCVQGARRVVEAHGGAFDIDIDPAKGIRLRVMLT